MLLNILTSLLLTNSEPLIAPPVLPADKISLVFYSRENCIGCQETKPHFAELRERIKEDNYQIKVKEIDCNKYNCHERNIIKLPSLILYEGDKEINRTVGAQTYDELAEFVLQNTDIEKEVFNKVKEQGKVRTLYERDFYNEFKGPWLILFFDKKYDPIRETIRQIAHNYDQRINVAEISKSSSNNIAMKYNIRQFPTILALYDGIQTFYSEGNDENRLSAFVDNLIAPSFEELTFDKFQALKQQNEPFFVSFSTDLQLNNYYFKEKAHAYKTRAKIYRSSDPKMFANANVFPAKGAATDEEKVVLTVYKGGKFHRYPHKLDNEDKLVTWIFHSHFPHLTRVSNNNFQQIFHGIKPVLLLMTENEKYDMLLEGIADKISHGLPFLDILFATIDTDRYPSFVSNLLPGLETPSVVIYDPMNKLFYHRKLSFENHFFEQLKQMVEDYTADKIKPYTGKKSNKYKIMISLVIVAVVVSFGLRYIKKRNIYNKKRIE